MVVEVEKGQGGTYVLLGGKAFKWFVFTLDAIEEAFYIVNNRTWRDDMIKFTAINKQHAEIAQKQVEAIGLKAKVVGRSVLVAFDWNQPDSGQQERIICIITQAMAHTDTPTEWDVNYMNEGKNEN